MYWVIAVGFAFSLAILVLSLARGRTKARYFVPWVVAIVALATDTAVHLLLSVAVFVRSPQGGGWAGIATLAFAALLVSAILQPRLAGWAFAFTALLMPATLFVVGSIPGVDTTEMVPMEAMLGIYSTRALIVGALLVISAGFGRKAPDESASQIKEKATSGM